MILCYYSCCSYIHGCSQVRQLLLRHLNNIAHAMNATTVFVSATVAFVAAAQVIILLLPLLLLTLLFRLIFFAFVFPASGDRHTAAE